MIPLYFIKATKLDYREGENKAQKKAASQRLL